MAEGIINSIVTVGFLISIGYLAHHLKIMKAEHNRALTGVLLNFFMPALILDSLIANPLLSDKKLLFLTPAMGLLIILISFAACIAFCRFTPIKAIQEDKVKRSFILVTGIQNYGFIGIPIVDALWGKDSVGILLLHNMGVELCIWSVGVLILKGEFSKEALKKVINMPLVAVVLGFAINLFDIHVPMPINKALHAGAGAAIPIGLMAVGLTVAAAIANNPQLINKADLKRIVLPALILRNGLLPLILLAFSYWAFLPESLRQVLAIQVAMPAAFLPIVLASYYGTCVKTATQIGICSFFVGLLTIPLWLSLSLARFF